MALTINGRNWIAEHLGIGDCMTETEQPFTYRDSVSAADIADSGGTAKILNRLIDNLVPYVTINGIQHTYVSLRAANGGNDVIYPEDVQWVMANDSGTTQYCATAAPPPGDMPTTGPFQVTIVEGVQCAPGAPTVILDTTNARAYFKVAPTLYVGVMGIDVTNVNVGDDCFGFFVWEMRMWPGAAGTDCPTTVPEVQQISRFLATQSDFKSISPAMLGTNEQDMIGGSFEIPAGTHGTYTLCLSLWGNHDKQALLDELADAGYAENEIWT